MTREEIIAEIKQRGYEAKRQDVIKNGVKMEAIVIRNPESNTSPCIYADPVIEEAEKSGWTISQTADKVIQLHEKHKETDFDYGIFSNPEYIREHLYIALQPAGEEEDLLKRESEFEGIEEYLYIRWYSPKEESQCSIKVKLFMLTGVGITLSEAWEIASQNTASEIEVKNIVDTMSELGGIPEEDLEEMREQSNVYVVSNRIKMKGAACVRNKEVLKELAENLHTDKLVILPSSIHEMLVTPYVEDFGMQGYSQMVSEVNATQVAPTDRLVDRAYLMAV